MPIDIHKANANILALLHNLYLNQELLQDILRERNHLTKEIVGTVSRIKDATGFQVNSLLPLLTTAAKNELKEEMTIEHASQAKKVRQEFLQLPKHLRDLVEDLQEDMLNSIYNKDEEKRQHLAALINLMLIMERLPTSYINTIIIGAKQIKVA